MTATCLAATAGIVLASGWAMSAEPAARSDPVPAFETDIRPLFAKRCTKCHSGPEAKNRLDLGTHASVLKGGKSGGTVTPGSLRDSLLWSFVATDKMPAAGTKLTEAEKGLIRRWILAGAPDAAGAPQTATSRNSKNRPADRPTEKRGVATTAQTIDERIAARLTAAGIPASPPADDATFLRRVYLDLAGRVPSYDETRRFLESRDPDRRTKLIDERLAAPEYGRHFATVWHKLLIPKSSGTYRRIPHDRFKEWLAAAVDENRGWDAIVTDLVTAEGYLPSDKDNGLTKKNDAKRQPQNVATAFVNVHNTEGRPQPKGIVASVSRLFLAQSIECAQCHNHPLAKWTRDDFWGAAAFFERVRYTQAVFGDEQVGQLVEPASGPDLRYADEKAARYAFVPGVYPEPVIDQEDPNGLRTGRMVRVRFLDGIEPHLESGRKPRSAFAAWMTAPENPFFAKAAVNRLWGRLLGRGFVEPVDDMSEDNPPSHPELLDDLAAEFVASGYDLKHLVRCIAHSAAYQRSSVPRAANREDRTLFARQSLRQMSEHELLDSLRTVLPTFEALLAADAMDKNPGLLRSRFLEIHETPVDGAADHTRGLQQALRMMNGDGALFNREALASIVSAEEPIEENVRRVYLLAFARPPSPDESTRMSAYVRDAAAEIARDAASKRPSERKKGQADRTPDPFADLLWVLLNSGEFIFNH